MTLHSPVRPPDPLPLKEFVKPVTRIGIAVQGQQGDQNPSPAGAELVSRIPTLFGATLVTFPIIFDEKLSNYVLQHIEGWVNGTDKM